jgi:hypothetical protein
LLGSPPAVGGKGKYPNTLSADNDEPSYGTLHGLLFLPQMFTFNVNAADDRRSSDVRRTPVDGDPASIATQ